MGANRGGQARAAGLGQVEAARCRPLRRRRNSAISRGCTPASLRCQHNLAAAARQRGGEPGSAGHCPCGARAAAAPAHRPTPPPRGQQQQTAGSGGAVANSLVMTLMSTKPPLLHSLVGSVLSPKQATGQLTRMSTVWVPAGKVACSLGKSAVSHAFCPVRNVRLTRLPQLERLVHAPSRQVAYASTCAGRGARPHATHCSAQWTGEIRAEVRPAAGLVANLVGGGGGGTDQGTAWR